MKKKKYLPFYIDCMNTMRMPLSGLCSNMQRSKLLKLFTPSQSDLAQLSIDEKSQAYWASNLHYSDYGRFYEFTTLRQTIVLFMAAMNNEL